MYFNYFDFNFSFLNPVPEIPTIIDLDTENIVKSYL